MMSANFAAKADCDVLEAKLYLADGQQEIH